MAERLRLHPAQLPRGLSGRCSDLREADSGLVRQGDEIHAGAGREGWSGEEWLSAYASILRNFLEGYRVAARSLAAVLDKPLPEKEMMRKALTLGNNMFLNGDIQRWEAVSK